MGGASTWSCICSQSSRPDAVTDGHVLFRLHQPKAVAAEVKLRDLRVRVDQLKVKVHQHEEHESAERGVEDVKEREREGTSGIRQESNGFLLSLTPTQSTGVYCSPKAHELLHMPPSVLTQVHGPALGDGM